MKISYNSLTINKWTVLKIISNKGRRRIFEILTVTCKTNGNLGLDGYRGLGLDWK